MTSPQSRLIYLLSYQRKDIPTIGNYGKMSFDDIKRIDKYIPNNIFIGDDCVIWNGEKKNKYNTMSYNSKKVSVLRLLLHNYVNDIKENDCINYLCENNGTCVKLSHINVIDNDDSTKVFEKIDLKKYDK